MKKILFTLSLVLCVSGLSAQNCYFFPAPGKEALYSIKAVTPMGSQEAFSVVRARQTDKTAEVVTDVKMTLEAAPVQTVTVKYQDMGDYYVADVKESLSSLLASLGDFSLDLTSGELRYPKKMVVGATQPDVKGLVKANVQGMAIEMELLITDRTVGAKETVEVPAGKFECFRFTEKMVMSVMGQEQDTQTTYWIAPEVGLIKQQTSVQGGMMNTSLELQSIK